MLSKGGTSCPISSAKGWDFMSSSLSVLRFDLAWIFTDLVCDVTTVVSSYVQLPCHAKKTVLPCSPLLSLAPTLFTPPLLQ